MNTKRRSAIIIGLAMILALTPMLGSAMATTSSAPSQMVEYILRTTLTSTEKVFDTPDGQTVVIGFNTTSSVILIPLITNSEIPSDTGTAVGQGEAQIRFLDSVHLNRNTPYQRATVTGSMTLGAMRIYYKGMVGVRWVQELSNSPAMDDFDQDGTYSGIRWTDFSAGVTRIEGPLSDWNGHIVGTRFMVNLALGNDIQADSLFQRGLLILRLMRFDSR